MKPLRFDPFGLLVGGMIFAIYLMVFEDTFFVFPRNLITFYLMVCVICFSLVLDEFPHRFTFPTPSLLYRLIYPLLWLFAPFYLVYLHFSSKS
ncbi:hypothetical protein ACVR1I_02835 [Streptococcus cameli]